MTNLRISHYEANDGDGWYSVESEYEPGKWDLATGVMHGTATEAVDEAESLQEAD